MKTISIVIAVFRNEKAVTETYRRIRRLFDEKIADYEFEIVFVDDGSDDDSLPEVLGLRQDDERVKVLSFTRNFGQMAAMLAGFHHAEGDAVINLSADLQDPVDLIPQMIASWEAGSDVAICYRRHRHDGLASRVFSRIAYGVLRLSVPKLPTGGFERAILVSNQ